MAQDRQPKKPIEWSRSSHREVGNMLFNEWSCTHVWKLNPTNFRVYVHQANESTEERWSPSTDRFFQPRFYVALWQTLSAHRHVTMECSTGGCRLVVGGFYTSKIYPERVRTLSCVCAAIHTCKHTHVCAHVLCSLSTPESSLSLVSLVSFSLSLQALSKRIYHI